MSCGDAPVCDTVCWRFVAERTDFPSNHTACTSRPTNYEIDHIKYRCAGMDNDRLGRRHDTGHLPEKDKKMKTPLEQALEEAELREAVNERREDRVDAKRDAREELDFERDCGARP